jgi:cobalt/nickel transport system permease protein
MSHLHIPDGILPPILWILGLVLTALCLAWSAWAGRGVGTRGIAFQSALGGIMLAVMALPVPITAFDYCMTLAGPVGVLLGAAGAFQVSFVVTLILALLGQGGFTVIGLNALVLGLSAVAARPVYRLVRRPLGAARAMAVATAISQLGATVLWVAILLLSVKLSPEVAGEHEVRHQLVAFGHRLGIAVVVPTLLLAVTLEGLLGYGLARFLDRVRPDLLPFGDEARPGPGAPR